MSAAAVAQDGMSCAIGERNIAMKNRIATTSAVMMACITNIDWHDPAAAVPAFLTIVMMVLTYSISYGIAFGFISYTLIKLCTGKIRRKVDEEGNLIEEGIHPITAVLSVLFLLNFLLVTH